MDPVQQKMMMYLLPGVFTVMMLFLPAALGVYMLTNSVLGIAQQLAVEQLAPRGTPGGPGEIVVKQVATSKGDLEANGVKQLGKGKARV
jgi:YidC/Oxa1 family membrane protein insertase